MDFQRSATCLSSLKILAIYQATNGKICSFWIFLSLIQLIKWPKFPEVVNFCYIYLLHSKYPLLTKFCSELVKIGRGWSKDVFGQGDLDDQYPNWAQVVTWLVLWIISDSVWLVLKTLMWLRAWVSATHF